MDNDIINKEEHPVIEKEQFPVTENFSDISDIMPNDQVKELMNILFL